MVEETAAQRAAEFVRVTKGEDKAFYAQQTSSELREHRNSSVLSVRVIQSMRVIAIKSIVHAAISSLAAILYVHGGSIGFEIWTLLVLVGMHITFNMRVEKWSICAPNKVRALTRSEREVEVMQRGRDENFSRLIEVARRRAVADRDEEEEEVT
jgi:hypothetical protein